MAHRAVDGPNLRERVIAAWGGRATIRRNLTIAASDALLMVFALQAAFPELSAERSALFSTITRVLYGAGLWLTSRAVRRFTGEVPRDEPDPALNPNDK